MITILDYGAGNVRSVRNALIKLGCQVKDAASADDVIKADKLVFPGVGSFGLVMSQLVKDGYVEPLLARIRQNLPFLGICVALQAFFEGSEESPGIAGLGLLPGQVKRFNVSPLSVPHIGWNDIKLEKSCSLFQDYQGEKMYFVHSYHGILDNVPEQWRLAATDYGEEFVSAICQGNVAAFQFHPEKSGTAGLNILKHFVEEERIAVSNNPADTHKKVPKTQIAKRIIACLDVRSNDQGDLVVTKGDQYNVRESGEVRNLGKPVELASRYFEEGADEITFLNITGFRDFPLTDQPMLDVLKKTSEKVFVPLTIGGGIREFTDSQGTFHSSLDVASEYFRSGADKISIGSDAVYIAEDYRRSGKASGTSSIEQISQVYGAQAVVISVDPRRVYVQSPGQTSHHTIETEDPGPGGEKYCWYQCTVKGGREGRDLDVIELVTACEKLGAGEILLNCIDKDGTNSGFDLELIGHVRDAVSIPVIASSGAGSAAHFYQMFSRTDAEAGLAAGIFHREEVRICDVKALLAEKLIPVR
jgi:glutamine amidotransferase/cyclase